jgi:hypothetical protein
MTRALATMSVLMLLLCSGCGGDTPQKVADDSIDVMKEMTSILEGVKDEASAAKAHDKLQALGDKFKALRARQDKLQMSPEEKQKLEAEYRPKMEPVMQKLMSESMRVAMDPKLAPAIKGLDNVMTKP